MRSHSCVLFIALVASCGRVGFDSSPQSGGDGGGFDAPVPPDTAPAAPCFEGDARVESGGHCYMRFDDVMGWNEARAACEQIGAHLVTITSEPEQSAVHGLFSTNHWIGATDQGRVENDFGWVTSEPLGPYLAWSPGEPNTLPDEHCVEMWDIGVWNDTSCDVLNARICERDRVPSEGGPCTEGESRLTANGHCYAAFRTALPALDAIAACQQLGGHLATITSRDENQLVRSLSNPTLLPGATTWLGLTDAMTEMDYQWMTGEQVTILPWATGEPNDFGGVEDCVEQYGYGDWNDWPCTMPGPYVCEREYLPVTCTQGEARTELAGHCYWRDAIAPTWGDARTRCMNEGGHLATITSLDENIAVQALVPASASAWVGASDSATEGTFVWVTAEAFSAPRWGTNEPNGGTAENCLQLLDTGEWNDVSCDTVPTAFICESP